jgi:peptidylprolyl isomerase
MVRVQLGLWSSEGTLLQSTAQRGGAVEVPLGKFRVGGLSEVIQTMVSGEKKVAWIPANVAFNGNPPAGLPEGGLIAEIELVSFKEAVPPPPVPADVAAAPADAEKTASGLAFKVLSKGSGTAHPKASDKVTVHYSGWTTDGKLFDSSVTRGEPSSFGLNQVIKGWTEGVQLMVQGEKRRFWIPAGLAYGDKPQGGAPSGTLVFDIELLEIGK